MKIYLTGGSGFIGGAIIRALKDRHELIAMSRSATSDRRLESLGAQPVRAALGDVRREMLAGCEAVIHCAAHIGPGGDRQFYHKVNVDGTRQLVTTAKEAGVKRFIHIGTEAGCFYGQHMRNIDETTPLVPDSPYHYPATKAQAEICVMAENDPARGFETLSIRPRFVWGPGDQTLLPNLADAARKGAFVWIDHGRYYTSTTHVANVVRAVELVVSGRGRGGEAYFVTDGEVRTFRNVITRFLATQDLVPGNLSVPGTLVRSAVFILQKSWEGLGIKKPLPINRFAVALLSRDCTIRIDKARRELGYEPAMTFEEGLRELSALRGSG